MFESAFGVDGDRWPWEKTDLDADRVLSEALAHLDGLGDMPITDRARILRQHLQMRGYIVQPASAPILND